MNSQKGNKYLVPFIIVTTLFFLWGFITVLVDALIPRLKDVFELTNFKAGLVQIAWFLAYGLLSIPAGIMISRIGYKKGIITGLCLAGLGCMIFYPAAQVRVYGIFLMALFVVAGGITILQVAANPYIAVLGSEDRASSRLNLAQAFNSVGTTIAPIIAAAFLLGDKINSSETIAAMTDAAREAYYASEAAAVQSPFLLLGFGFFILAGTFLFVPLPKILGGDSVTSGNKGSFLAALKHKGLLLGAIGIFVYVGAEVAIGSYLTLYFMDMELYTAILENPALSSIVEFIAKVFKGTSIEAMDNKGVVASFVMFYWGGAMIGRFIGSYLCSVLPPSRVLSFFAVGAITLIVGSMLTDGLTAMWLILGVGLFNSIMFPTIFTLGLDGLGDLKPQGSGLLCTAIVGGAFIPVLYGRMADSEAIGYKGAFIVCILCYGFIMFYGFWKKRQKS